MEGGLIKLGVTPDGGLSEGISDKGIPAGIDMLRFANKENVGTRGNEELV